MTEDFTTAKKKSNQTTFMSGLDFSEMLLHFCEQPVYIIHNTNLKGIKFIHLSVVQLTTHIQHLQLLSAVEELKQY